MILTTYSKKDDILCQVFASSNTICKNGRFVMDISVNNKYMTKKDEKGLLAHIGGIAGLSSEEYEYNETDYGGNLKGKNDKVEVLISLRKTDDGDIKILLSIESDNEDNNDFSSSYTSFHYCTGTDAMARCDIVSIKKLPSL